MGGRGAWGLVYWPLAKKGSVQTKRIKGLTGGVLRYFAIWGLGTAWVR